MLVIKNFGHFWNRNHVHWGARGRGGTGALKGFITTDRRKQIVDFRDQIGVYVLFTSASQREAIYIGQSGTGENQRLLVRLRQHTTDDLRDRWQYFSWFGFRAVNQSLTLSEHQRPDSRCGGTHMDALNEIEAVLLQLFEPRLNKRGPNWGGDTVQYRQYVEGEANDDDEAIE